MKRVYLASRYSRREEMKEHAIELEENGFVVSSSWLKETFDPNMTLSALEEADHQEIAEHDLDDVIGSDIMIFFAEDQNNQPPRGGRHVEFGFALALGVEIYVIGEKENIFHYLPNIKVFPSFEDLMEVL